MRLKHDAKRLVRRFGFDVVRFPIHDATARTAQLLSYYGIDSVLDVGANDGGFASEIRQHGFNGRIISFEPTGDQYQALRRRAGSDPKWECVRRALGDSDAEVTINISGNSGLSSSVLPMLEAHVAAAPSSRYVSSERVQQQRLDHIFPELDIARDSRVFLKIDVQGYERQVLDGASGLFSNGLIVGLQLELSLVPLYQDAMPYDEALEHARNLGMALMGLDPVLADPQSGRLLQADAVFFAEQ